MSKDYVGFLRTSDQPTEEKLTIAYALINMLAEMNHDKREVIADYEKLVKVQKKQIAIYEDYANKVEEFLNERAPND